MRAAGINDRCYSIHGLTRTFLQEQVARVVITAGPGATNTATADFPALFREYIVNSVQAVLADIAQSDAILTTENHDRALHNTPPSALPHQLDKTFLAGYGKINATCAHSSLAGEK